MLSPLATTAAKRYCSLPVEVASTSCRPAPGARKIKVGTTLTLKIGPAADRTQIILTLISPFSVQSRIPNEDTAPL